MCHLQDEVYLQVIQTSGEGSERKNAASVLSLLKKGKHWVLVTLLLSNVITNETLPIVLDRSLGGGWPAVLGSTVLIGTIFLAVASMVQHILTMLLGLYSYLWRNCPPIDMRPLRSSYRCLDGPGCSGSYVCHVTYCLARGEAAGQATGRRPWDHLQESWSENIGDVAQNAG